MFKNKASQGGLMAKVYNKLVRDHIPEICKSNNQTAKTRVLNHDEYEKALNEKLLEEVNEYLASEDVTELADILEVVDAIAVSKGSSFDDILKIKQKKAGNNGKFDKKLFLIEVE